VHGRHADGVGAERAERADLGGGLEARAADGEVDAVAERDLELVGGGVQGGAESFGPARTFMPVRLMWSVIAMSDPGMTSGRSEPAAFVSTMISAPAARSARTGVRMRSLSPPS
jgi:hypothetical protein